MPLAFTAHAPEHLSLDRILDGPGEWVIGRESDCDLIVPHDSVSRRHAVLICDPNDQWSIQDRNSKNGLRVDGRRVTVHALPERTRLAIGDVYVIAEPIGDAEAGRRRGRSQIRRDSVTQWAMPPVTDAPESRLRDLLGHLCGIAECERGLLFDVTDGRIGKALAARGIAVPDWQSDPFDGSRGALIAALDGKQPVFLSRSADTQGLAANDSVLRGGIGALAAIPLQHPPGSVIGLCYLDTLAMDRAFTELDGELLQAFSDRAAAVLAVALLDQKLTELERRLGP